MATPFEALPTQPRAQELIDQAFSRAGRAGHAKDGIDAQLSMVRTAANAIGDNCEHVVTTWPDFDAIDPFYRDLADAVAGIDELRQALSTVDWVADRTGDIRSEYESRVARAGDTETARTHRKQAFARLADITEQATDALERLAAAREALTDLPEIDPSAPTIVVAGSPNVGKSSFVNHVTRADSEVATYPFTTTQIHVGHLTRDHVRYQIVDTPGLLDRPAAERNDVERQAASALGHVADCVLVVLDASESCGYTRETQLALLASLREEFTDAPVLTVCNKSDLSTDVDAEYAMSVTEDEGVADVVAAAIEAIDYEPVLPHEE
ncbi:NOG1 family protein [Halococcoides cellulosivorans]|uniref:GTP-binding protein n=1 Tax=Halococcoides cellulosivorans TaxID=1679096 RepID=A0A2R4WYE5_9EURY|nr:GTPase [Halococcoides cellulosivorans]AWB26541.1 GTP-binding protein [Halococcoides cellulosivorans]